MDDFTGLSVAEFLDRLAERTPTPGGGSVAGLAGALACAMARMVAAYSINKKSDAEAIERVDSVSVRLGRAELLMRALITKDAEAYESLTAATREARRDPSYEPGRAEALLNAISVPLETAGVASNLLAALDEFKEHAGKYLLSDLGVAAVLADASARAAAYSVRINARDLADEDARTRILSDTQEILTHCGQRRESIERFVDTRLEIASG